MTDIESLFLAIYPLWPKAMLTKFASVMQYEIAKYNAAIDRETIKIYDSLGGAQKIKIEPYIENQVSLLAPSNQSKLRTVYYGKTTVKITTGKYVNSETLFLGDSLAQWITLQGKITFDDRIFSSVTAKVEINYVANGYRFTHSFLSFMSYDSVYLDSVTPVPVIELHAVLKPYSGAEAVLAMIENGVQINTDQKLLKEFVTCINAYKKYGGQLAAANSLQAEKNRQALADYKTAANEKLAQRKNELADMKTQIVFAAKNETNSAKRDMQNLMLSAQSLILQLQDKLK